MTTAGNSSPLNAAPAAVPWKCVPVALPRKASKTDSPSLSQSPIDTSRVPHHSETLQEQSVVSDEVRRIADELHKLRNAGVINSQEDASFFANLVHLFGATFDAGASNVLVPGEFDYRSSKM